MTTEQDCPDQANHHRSTRCASCGTRFARLATTRREFEQLAGGGIIATDYVLAELQKGLRDAEHEEVPF
jgi:hypothetical protein